jgi:hypothetical protein
MTVPTSAPRPLAGPCLAGLVLGLLLVACGGSGPAPATPPATAAPTSVAPIVSASPDAGPSTGDCVETDQEIGALTTLQVFRTAPCLSPLARYRVLAVLPVGLTCPDASEFRVEWAGRLFCLASLASAEPSQQIDVDVVAGDCVQLAGEIEITAFVRVDCTDPSATHRVLATFDSIVPDCPAGTDQRITITLPLGTGGGNLVACLAAVTR